MKSHLNLLLQIIFLFYSDLRLGILELENHKPVLITRQRVIRSFSSIEFTLWMDALYIYVIESS